MRNLEVHEYHDPHYPKYVMYYIGTTTTRYSYFYESKQSAQYCLEKGSFEPLPEPVLIRPSLTW